MLGGVPPAAANPLARVGRAVGDLHHAPAPNAVPLQSPTRCPAASTSSHSTGKVLGVLGEAGKELKQFGWIHEIACPSENELYVAELLNWRVQKLILRP